MWHSILAKFGRGPRRPQSDEESLGAKQGQRTTDLTPINEKGERKSSGSSFKGNDSRRSEKEEGDAVAEASGGQYEGSEPQYKLKNTHKAGYHGESWEKTEKRSEGRQGQESGGKSKAHATKYRKTQQPADDAEMQTEADKSLEEKKAKETGYDGPDHDVEENDVGEVASHDNET